tara:strand:- start:1111 stop:1344 length:234 start_codon:yes stop_codon:yes gene_type:complete
MVGSTIKIKKLTCDFELIIVDDLLKIIPYTKRADNYISNYDFGPRIFSQGNMFIADQFVSNLLDDLREKEFITIDTF